MGGRKFTRRSGEEGRLQFETLERRQLLTAELLAYFDFDDASNPAQVVDKVNGRVGNLIGAAKYTADTRGRSGTPGDRALDSQSGQMVVSEVDFLGQVAAEDAFTISFWQKIDVLGGSSVLHVRSPSSAFERGIFAHAPWADNSIYFDTGGCCGASERIGVAAPYDLTDQWRHYAFRKDGDTKSIWLDGVKRVEAGGADPVVSDLTELLFGSTTTNELLDELAIYSGALSDFKIQQLATGERPALPPEVSPQPELLAYFDFDDPADPFWTLDAVHGRVGSLAGVAYTADAGGRSGLAGDYGINTQVGQMLVTDAGFLSQASAIDQVTVSFWQRVDALTGSHVFHAKSPSSAYERGIFAHAPWTDNSIYFDTAGCCDATQRVVASAGQSLLGQWHHYVLRKDGDVKSIWLDGVQLVEAGGAAPLPDDWTELLFGSSNTGELLDELAIYSGALSDYEIQQLADGKQPDIYPSNPHRLIAYYDFNDPSVVSQSVDVVNRRVGNMLGAVYTADAGGRTGIAGDYGLDTVGGQFQVPDDGFVEELATADQVTVSFWQKIDALTGSHVFQIKSPSSAYERGVFAHAPWTDNFIYFDTGGCCSASERIGANAGQSLLGQWHHYVLRKDGDLKSIWLDGVKLVEAGGADPLPSDLTELLFGSPSTGELLDDLAVFADALPESKIQRLAAGESPLEINRLSRATVPVAEEDVRYYTAAGVDLTVGGTSGVLANDELFGSPLQAIGIEERPTGGQLLAFGIDGGFTYRPNPGFAGVDTFTYRVFTAGGESSLGRVAIAVGTPLLARSNQDSNVLHRWSPDPWLATSLLVPTTPSAGLANGLSNIPVGSSQATEGGLAATGGLQLVEDVAQDVALVYRSDSLTRPIITIDTSLAPGASLPTTLSAQLTFGGVTGPQYSYSTAGLQSGQSLRFALQADGTGLATGMVDFTVEVQATVDGVLRTQSFSGKQAIVNRDNSEFGAGWGLDGLDRLLASSTGALMVRGNGDSLWFPLGDQGYAPAAGDISRSDLQKLADGTFTLTSKTGIVSTFSVLGLLNGRSDSNGNLVSYQYADQDGDTVADELVSMVDAYGRTISFAYAGNLVDSVTHFSGKVTTLDHTGTNLTSYSLTDPDGAGSLSAPTVGFGYSGSVLTSRTDAVQDTTTFEFDAGDGRLRTVVHPDDTPGDAQDNDRWQLVPSQVVGLPTGVSNNAPVAARPAAVVTDQRTHTWEFHTDRFGGVIESTTALGNEHLWLRNADGLVYKFVEPDPDGPTGLLESPVTLFGYNQDLDLTRHIAADGGLTQMRYTYDFHRLAGMTDPVGREQNIDYDNHGNATDHLDGGGFKTTIAYDARGRVTSITEPDPDGPGPLAPSVTSLAYDTFGRLSTTTNPDGSTQSTTYNSADQPLTLTDELGKNVTLAYDDLGRATSATNRISATTQWSYDAMSRVIQQVDPLGYLTDVEYDDRGRLDKITYPDPDGAAGSLLRPVDDLIYDSVGNLLFHNDPGGNYQGQVPYTYDEDNRVATRGISTGPADVETYVYDHLGRIREILRPDAGGDMTLSGTPPFSVLLSYDPMGRVIERITRPFVGSESAFFQETFKYNAAGELVERADGNDNVYANEYDGRGFLIRETLPDPDGNGPQFPLVVSYTFDNMGRMTETDRGFGRVTQYAYDSRSRLTQITESDPDGSGPLTSPVSSLAYDLRSDTTSLTDPLGRVTSWVYDDEQRLVSQVDSDPDGAGPLASPVTTWAYNLNNWTTTVTDAVGATTGFQYDALGRLTTQTDPDPDDGGPLTSPVTQIQYNDFGLALVQDPLGHQTTYTLDARGRVTSMQDTAGGVSDYTYDFYDNLLEYAAPDPDGVGPLTKPTTKYHYDGHNRLVQEVDPLQGITEYTYDLASNLQSIADSNGNVTTFSYDNWSRVTAETNQLGKSRYYTYDTAGNLARTADRNGRVTRYVYDGLDRQVEEQWQSNSVTAAVTVDTNQQGANLEEQQVVGWSLPNAAGMGGTFEIFFAGQFTGPLAWDADDATIQAALEALPNVGAGNIRVSTSWPEPYNRSIKLTFTDDRAGQNLAQTQLLTSSLVPTPTAGLVSISQTTVQGGTFAEEQTIDLSGLQLDGAWYVAYGGEVSEALVPNILPAQLQAVLNGFDGIDSVTVTGTIGHFTVTFGGSQAGIDMQQILADGTHLTTGLLEHTISTEYNAASELVSISEPSPTFGVNRDLTFTRDNLGRTINITSTYDAGNLGTASLDQTFDAVGNRTQLAATLDGTPDFINTYSYDKLRRMTEVVQTGQAGANWILPKRVTQAFNALGQRTRIERFESTGSTSPVASTDFVYDSTNRLQSLTHQQGPTLLNSYTYGYDFQSRVVSVDSTLDDLTTYSYDTRSQLQTVTNAAAGVPDESFDYDANGNRNLASGYTVTADNRTTQDPDGATYEYDHEGNLTQADYGTHAWNYEWDHRNRLVKATLDFLGNPSAQVIEYQYDAFNRLHSRSTSASVGTTYWIYDEGINPVLQFDTGGDPRQLYLWSDAVDDLLAAEEIPADPNAGNILWALQDHLGSIRDIADLDDSTGITSITNHRRYSAFGELLSETNPAVDLVFGYTGKFFDEATKLQNNLNRWYDPNLGKWVSQDPIGFNAGDPNLYRYVGNGPVDATDPSGLEEPIEQSLTTEEWEEYFHRQNQNRLITKSQEAQKKRERGDWGYRIAELPIMDLIDPLYLAELWWQDMRDWRTGRPTTFALRPLEHDPNMYIAVDPFGGMIGRKGLPTGNKNPLRYKDKVDELLVAPKVPLRYKLGANDVDWRGTGKTVTDALDDAFAKTGHPSSEFTVTRWGKDKWGKSHPVEWRGPDGAEVNIDWPHHGVDRHGNWVTGPDAPHVGWQVGKRSTKTVGHIILDNIPFNR